VRLQPRTEPDPPASFQRDVLDHPGAKQAFQKLTGQGINEGLLWRHLWGLASLAKKSKQQAAPWYSLPGLPSHTLRRLPARVRGWADEIERVGKRMQSHQLYGQIVHHLPLFLAGAIPNADYELVIGDKVIREVGIAKPGLPADLARGILERHAELPKLAELPELLRLYADYIEALSKITAHYGSKGVVLLRRNMPLELARLVESCTGRPHFDKVATLLTASYQAIGCGDRVDPRALAMQRSRTRPKK